MVPQDSKKIVKGEVRDAKDQTTGLDSVTVTALGKESRKVLAKVETATDGTYSLNDLDDGVEVTLQMQKEGYLQDPECIDYRVGRMAPPVVLLVKRDVDPDYARAFAQAVKARAREKDDDGKTKELRTSWDLLQRKGMKPTGLVVFAESLSLTFPELLNKALPEATAYANAKTAIASLQDYLEKSSTIPEFSQFKESGVPLSVVRYSMAWKYRQLPTSDQQEFLKALPAKWSDDESKTAAIGIGADLVRWNKLELNALSSPWYRDAVRSALSENLRNVKDL
jgi:hypothetical protein